MTEHLQPGPHLDADQLAAFAEGALAGWEREQAMLHLAGCEACREVLFLAQIAVQNPAEEAVVAPAVIVIPTPIWRRLAPLAVATALAACLVTAVLVLRPKHPVAPQADVAQVAPPPAVNEAAPADRPAAPQAAPRVHRPTVQPTRQPAPQPTAADASSADQNSAVAANRAGAADRIAAAPAPLGSVSDDASIENLPLNNRNAIRLAAPQPAVAGMAAGTGRAVGALVQPLPASPLGLRIEHGQTSTGEFAKIAGTVLDPTGASVPGATVTLRPAAGAAPTQVKTDARGGFNLAGLPAGHYDLQIAAPGFATVTRSLDLQARDLALLTSPLQPGAASETVTVEAAAAALDTDSSTLASTVQAMTQTVAQGKRILGLDPDGAVSLSTNRGRRWKKVKPQWTGKVVHIAASGDGFEITTDANAVWLSQDGKHWRQR